MSPHRSARTVVAALALAVAGALAPATSAAAEELPLSATDQAVHDRLTLRSSAQRLGDDLAGLVVDAETGQEVWSHHPVERQIPASNVKLITAVNALQAFGPGHRFVTRVMTGATARRVVLVGSGDPSLSRADLRRLARQTVATSTAMGLRRVRVDVDDTLFPAPTLARGWKASYVTADVSPSGRSWSTSTGGGTPRWTPGTSSPGFSSATG